jgi:glycosyltransferase involved in cell wall biosynthesis
MKIIYVAGVGKYGTYVLSCDLFTAWLKHGYEIVCVGPIPHKLFLEFMEQHRIPFYFIPLIKPFRLDQAWRLAIVARRERVNVIHACNLPGGRFLCRVAGLLANIPVILYLSTSTKVHYANRLVGFMKKIIHRWSVVTAQGLIAMTQYLADELCDFLGISKKIEIVVIPMGVNLSVIRKKSKSGDIDLAKPMRVVHVTRLAPEKGQDIVLRATDYVIKKGYKICVDFIGDETIPGYRDYLFKVIEELHLPDNAFNFLGYHPISQVYRELADYDLFVHPSRSEGQGIAVLEAMAAGLPVVASSVGGLKELVVHGETGLLVSNGDHRALAEAIIWFMLRPAKIMEMGESGYQRVKAKFSFESTEYKIMEFYNRFAARFVKTSPQPKVLI